MPFSYELYYPLLVKYLTLNFFKVNNSADIMAAPTTEPNQFLQPKALKDE
ncbi:hypothetical protein M2246_003789 [Bacillus sp. LEw-kw-24]|nr:hypothetical protein [Bacillus sp. LEw-kw-24]MDH6559134.1 hypothetical protein [Bacillus sp. LEw-kw-2]MDH8705506.1 hypothetical protein [Stenotrophomonas sp. 1198]OFD08423.1 hypothetical protein BTGOE7_19190 [Bacillus thuringiensis]